MRSCLALLRKAYVEHLQPGMRIAQPVLNEAGGILLAKGAELSDRYIEALRGRGFFAVYIQDGIGDDVEVPDIVSDQVRYAAHKHVKELFAVVKSAVDRSKHDNKKSPMANVTLPEDQAAELYRDVEKIVHEVMDSDTLTGVASLKSHDGYTFEHSVEVTVVGVLLGKRLHLSLHDLHELALGCLCHDIGKTSVSADILNKPGHLTSREYATVKQRP